MPNFRGSEWLIIILIIALLFGAKRLPDAARGLGRSLRIFKAETKGLTESDETPAGAPAPPPAVTSAPSAAPATPVAPIATSGVPAPAEPTGPALQPQAEVVPPALQRQPPSQA